MDLVGYKEAHSGCVAETIWIALADFIGNLMSNEDVKKAYLGQ